jgi:hypothetical protein
MSIQALERLSSEPKSDYGSRDASKEAGPASYVLPILPWDEIALRWPKARFSSFFPVQQNS